MSPEELQQAKAVEYCASGVSAWYNTSLEHDKALFALSAGGIGLLVTLQTSIGVSSTASLVLYICAIVCFLVSLISVLIIFKRNRSHIEQVLSAGGTADDRALATLDWIAVVAFGVGAILSTIIGISSTIESYNTRKEREMASEKKTQPVIDVGKKSFNGIGKLSPTEIASSPAPAQTPASEPAPVLAPAPAPASGSNEGKSGGAS